MPPSTYRICSAHLQQLCLSVRLRLTIALLIVTGFGLLLIIGPVFTAAPQNDPRQPCLFEQEPGCRDKAQFDIAFVVDQSRSIAERGQTYNVEIEGIIRAVRDPTIIPYDGSVSLSVISFNEVAVVRLPIRNIRSSSDAEAFARDLENLKCPNIGSTTDPCPCSATNFDAAIKSANNHLNQNRRPGARRVILMSTDGMATDPDMGMSAAAQAHLRALQDGVVMEFNIFLLGLGADEEAVAKAKVDKIVFPQLADDLPGAALIIRGGECNILDANPGADGCDQQSDEFAANVRKVLRSHVPHISFVVTTEEDLIENGTGDATSGKLSLRRAIELANCNQGAATITFAENVSGKTIRLVAPLPPLIAPDITIEGCDGGNCALVTIDGSGINGQLVGEDKSDGILIRSNHSVIRGLKVVNFPRAGIAVAPLCETDAVGRNLIESNTLENNAKAGVLILDPPQAAPQPGPQPGLQRVSLHNTGNTILQNTISQQTVSPGASPNRSALIDLGGDGPTANDPEDRDEGPNTLLNFPETLEITNEAASALSESLYADGRIDEANPVRIAGRVAGAAARNARVEIFSVTRLRTTDCSSSVIEGVVPLVIVTTDNEGAFVATGIRMSPTGAYTATLTDRAGNTSELRFDCAGSPKANVILENNATELRFDAVSARAKQKKPSKRQPLKFTIQNAGCSPLVFTFSRIDRIDGLNCAGDANCLSDASFFSITKVVSAGPPMEEELVFSEKVKGISVTIDPGKCQEFRVRFDPLIPGVTNADSALSAKDVLPAEFKSIVRIKVGNMDIDTVTLVGQVKTEVQLIGPKENEKKPVVILEKSGDLLTATYYIYESNQDAHTAKYEFFDGAGKTVPLVPVASDLRPVIANRKLVPGQSYGVVQMFSNANEHPEVRSIRVTVFDNETSVFVTSRNLVR